MAMHHAISSIAYVLIKMYGPHCICQQGLLLDLATLLAVEQQVQGGQQFEMAEAFRAGAIVPPRAGRSEH